ncbi:ribosome biogenesis GTPase YlqF [Butyrivibrio sp. NC3005]|uniref:ribosome biogenesis GTPase YlqF n=1 Tax=Butyrivibrio sp. NC3005 TaxID=1280685 RepID=UPI0003FC6395|nr:ribosome biogenesis GTPase YlqF [Butyrivibrio sp. NC3005]
MNYQWYPGHMTKAVRMMKENINLVDMIIEVIDARIPVASRNPDIDELGKGKARLLILNKADLSDPVQNKAWTDFYKSQGYLVMEMDSRTGKNMKDVKKCMTLACADKIERDRQRGIKNRPIRAMVAGIPNVGKSTFINHLTGKSSAKTGNKPGVTKGKQWIMLGSSLQLLDTPGILWPKFEDEEVGAHLAMIGSMNDEKIDSGELAIDLLRTLEKSYADIVFKKYNISDTQVEEEVESEQLLSSYAGILTCIAKNRNLVLSGNRVDYTRAADLLLDDFRSGRLGRITLERPV